MQYVDGLTQDSINPIANALELLQSCAEPSMCLSLCWGFDVLKFSTDYVTN